MNTNHILATVEPSRLQKAVEGLVSGTYAVTLASQTGTEIRGFVTNSDGREYGVVLSGEKAFCSCRDAMFRHSVCKHSVILALHAIRTPQTEAVVEAKEETRPVNLKLAKVRPGWVLSA